MEPSPREEARVARSQPVELQAESQLEGLRAESRVVDSQPEEPRAELRAAESQQEDLQAESLGVQVRLEERQVAESQGAESLVAPETTQGPVSTSV